MDVKLTHTSKTSMTIAVNVRAIDLKDEFTQTTKAWAVVMLALDEDGIRENGKFFDNPR